uniref:Nudix hydrolase domain-containing protein n=1 Tax=viral metagenome TaxID=1070528 RepID=A0A6M3KYS9_9ZZZZ
MKEYVVGFAFDHSCKSVLLIYKRTPEWQRGLINGIGGKIKKGELPIQAMVREFKEETGVETDNSDWIYFCLMTAGKEEIYCYYMIGGAHDATSMEDEVVRWFEVGDDNDFISNLNWLIPLALEDDLQKNKGINLFVKATYKKEKE